MITPFRTHRAPTANGAKFWYIIGRPHGRRVRAWFPTKKQAQDEANKRNRQIILGTYPMSRPQPAQQQAAQPTPSTPSSVTVRELITRVEDHYRKLLGRDEISKRHFETLRTAFRRLAPLAQRLVADLTHVQIESWLSSLPLSASTRNQTHRYLNLLFKFGVKHGILEKNPMEHVSKARSRKMKTIDILTPEEAGALIRCSYPETLPFFAISLFAGLRISEIQQLDWKHINLTTRQIDLSWYPTKTLQPRWVPILDNLAEILAPHAKPEGAVCPPNLRKLREQVEQRAGLWPWGSNAPRHSYISYRLALTQNVSQTACEAGHDVRTLAAWYRKPIQKEIAERYFSIIT